MGLYSDAERSISSRAQVGGRDQAAGRSSWVRKLRGRSLLPLCSALLLDVILKHFLWMSFCALWS